MSEAESSLAAKCLDFSQALTRQGKNFNFNLNLGSTFTFALDTRVKSSPPEMVRKKLSPYAIRRNARRKKDYLKRKYNPLETAEVDLETSGHDVDHFQCEQCNYRANYKVSLSKHIRKYYKIIPQIDGLEDVKTFKVKSVQTDDPKVMEYGMQTEYHEIKETEVQTDFTDTTTGVIGMWGEKDTLTL